MPAKEEARPPPEGASCDPGPAAAAPPGSPCRPPPPADPLDTRIVMGEETRCPPPEPRGGPPVPCPFPAPPKEPPPGRPPALDPELFFTAPSTPVRAGGARPPPEEPTDGDSEGLCSPPTSPSGSYMTAEGGSWGSSGTASTSPSCSPNLAAEAEGLGEAEGEAEGLGGPLALPPGLGEPPAFPPLSPEEEDEEDDEDGPFAPPGCADDDEDDDDDEDGQTPEEEEDEDEGSGLIPAALLPFRGSLLFQAEAVEISPRAPAEEEEEEEGSTSASFLRSLSESSIPEGGDEAFAFRDDTDASSDSAAYDGDEDERLYGTERHAGDTGTPPGTPPGPAGVELHLRAGSPCHPGSLGTAPAGDAALDGDAFVTIAGAGAPPETPAGAAEGSGAALGPCPELAEPGPRPPPLRAGEPQDGPGGDSDGDSDGDNDPELSTGTVGSADGHSELDSAATGLGTSVTPTPPGERDAAASDVVT
ncbi:NACAD protein, partial [Cettia cetti]|nr:NACAD protein [Cettia cetti]